jgi:hypothetical protein
MTLGYSYLFLSLGCFYFPSYSKRICLQNWRSCLIFKVTDKIVKAFEIQGIMEEISKLRFMPDAAISRGLEIMVEH